MFVEMMKELIPAGTADLPEYIFGMVEIAEKADAAMQDAEEKARITEQTLEEANDRITQLTDENNRLREVNIKALLNGGTPKEEEPEPEPDGDGVKTVAEIVKEGVDL